MGGKNVKPKKTPLNNDEMYMAKLYSGSTRFVSKWKKRYDFEPVLRVSECQRLITQLSLHDRVKNRSKRDPGKQMQQARLWYNESRRRVGTQGASAFSARNEDNEFVPPSQNLNNIPPGPSFAVGGAEGLPPQTSRGLPQSRVHSPGRGLKEEGGLEITTPALPSSSAQDLLHTSQGGEQMCSLEPPPAPVKAQKSKSLCSSGVVTRNGVARQIFRESEQNPSDPDDYWTDACPLIELPNGSGGTQLVYRVWTQDDVRKACEGIPKPEIDVESTIQGIMDLIRSYRLDGLDTQRALMCITGVKWHILRPDFDPMVQSPAAGNVAVPPRNRTMEEVFTELNREGGLKEKLRQLYKRSADHALISQTRQKSGESVQDFRARMQAVFDVNSGIPIDQTAGSCYQQQLKTAILEGLLPPIQAWLREHFVNYPISTMSEFMLHATHAETVVRESRGKGTAPGYVKEGVCTYVVQPQGKKKGFVNNRPQRGAWGRPVTEKDKDKMENRCYICHKKGHLANACKQNRNKQQRRADEGTA